MPQRLVSAMSSLTLPKPKSPVGIAPLLCAYTQYYPAALLSNPIDDADGALPLHLGPQVARLLRAVETLGVVLLASPPKR